MSVSGTRRVYGGVTGEERVAQRRRKLIDAGTNLFGSPASGSVRVKDVAAAAGLTERYFYESFTDREDFVRAVYDEVCTTAMAALTTSQSPRDAVERFVTMMVDDPTRGRVLLIAPAQEPVLTRSGADWMPSFIELLQHKMFPDGDPARADREEPADHLRGHAADDKHRGKIDRSSQ